MLYEKNVFYYQYIFNHVRSGKDSFVLPTKASIISHESNLFIIQLWNENARAILLQDSNLSEIKLYIKKTEILDIFRELFGNDISNIIKYSNYDILKYIYAPYDVIGEKSNISDSIIAESTDDDISIIKDRIYSLDFWIFTRYREKLATANIHHYYESPILLGLYAVLKETLF